MKVASKEISRELYKALDSIGVLMDVHFIYCDTGVIQWKDATIKDVANCFPAFTMCELWDLLPSTPEFGYPNLMKDYGGKGSQAEYMAVYSAPIMKKNPCDALAAVLLWSISEGHFNNYVKDKKQTI